MSTIIIILLCVNQSSLLNRLDRPKLNFGRIFLFAILINAAGYIFHVSYNSSLSYICVTTISILLIILLCVELWKIFLRSRLAFTLDIPITIRFCVVFQIFSHCSTSFIEEEHQTWYYLGSSFLLALFWKKMYNTRLSSVSFCSSTLPELNFSTYFVVIKPMLNPFLAVLLTVFVRRLNQTGDKWIKIPDVGDWFVMPDNKPYLSYFLAISLLLIIQNLREFNTPLQMVACISTCLSIYCYHGVMGTVLFLNVNHFKTFLVLSFYSVSVIYILASSYLPIIFDSKNTNETRTRSICKLLSTNLTCFTLISALLHKPHNVFLVFAIHLLLKCIYGTCDSLDGTRRKYLDQMKLLYKVFATICVCKMFYFFQGNSNSLATIDLNPGFIGLSYYNPLFVGIMVTINTYFADIFGFLYLMLELFQKQDKAYIFEVTANGSEKNSYNFALILMASIKLLTISIYLILMISFRHHLFIFTVFSPKLLYEFFSMILFYCKFSMINLYFHIIYKVI